MGNFMDTLSPMKFGPRHASIDCSGTDKSGMYITVEHWLTIQDSKSHRDMLNPVLILMPVLAVLSTYVSSGFEIMLVALPQQLWVVAETVQAVLAVDEVRSSPSGKSKGLFDVVDLELAVGRHPRY